MSPNATFDNANVPVVEALAVVAVPRVVEVNAAVP